jgi:hypothetical protein
MTSAWGDDRDYFAWEALFAVLSVPTGRSAIEQLLPAVPLEPRVVAIAESIEADWSAFPANNLRPEDLWAAVARLGSAVTAEELRELAHAARLLQPDPSGRAPIAWAWMRVLRGWEKHPGASTLSDSMVARCSKLLEFRPDSIGAGDPPEWQGLVEFAQGRLVSGEVRDFLLALSDEERGYLIETAKRAAEQLGTPGDLIEVPTFVGSGISQ